MDLAALAQPAQPARFAQANVANAANAATDATNGSNGTRGDGSSLRIGAGSGENGLGGSGKKGLGGNAGGSHVISFKEIQRQQQEEKERQRQKQKAETQKGWGSVLRQNVVPTSLIAREKKEEEAKQTTQTKQTSEIKEPVRSSSFLDGAKQRAGKVETRRMEGTENSDAFEEWCRDQMMELYGSDDISLLEFCRDLDDSQILLYLQDLLGTSKRVTAFGKEFIRRKHM